ncbi:MAG: phosphopyruvate hydratase [Eubacteriales bacterium]|nr:phosphopyruvate hydratase [Eubacteriales bacterium]
MQQPKIVRASAREILDSRGTPTLEASVYLSDGTVGTASVPSGASTGSHEAFEKRDGDRKRYGGKGVLSAVDHVNRSISPELTGMDAYDQYALDARLLTLDGTEQKTHLGANALLGVSLAAARAAANSLGLPLFRYLGGAKAFRLPVPMMNILNGGKHAANNLDIQEFMVVPLGAESMADAVRIGAEVTAALRELLKAKGLTVAVGDEGGCAPDLKDEREAIEWILSAIEHAGYHTDAVAIALDAAATEWKAEQGYRLPKSGRAYSAAELVEYWEGLVGQYPIVSIEDGMGEDDFDGWRLLTERLGEELMLVGDDLFVTNPRRLAEGIESGYANAILIKPNQIGTLTETLTVIDLAHRSGYRTIVSHRSGETEDTTIADLAVATSAPFIKTGAPVRGERTCKYNRLMKIERCLANAAVYGE